MGVVVYGLEQTKPTLPRQDQTFRPLEGERRWHGSEIRRRDLTVASFTAEGEEEYPTSFGLFSAAFRRSLLAISINLTIAVPRPEIEDFHGGGLVDHGFLPAGIAAGLVEFGGGAGGGEGLIHENQWDVWDALLQ